MLDIMIIIMLITILPIVIVLGILYIINKYLKSKFNPDKNILQKIEDSKIKRVISFIVILIFFIMNMYEVNIEVYVYIIVIFIISIIDAIISLKHVKNKHEDKNTYNYIIYKSVSWCIIMWSICIIIYINL